MHSAGVQLPDALGDGGAPQDGGKPELAAAGDEDAGGFFELGEVILTLSVFPGVQGEADDLRGAEFPEDALIEVAGVLLLRGGGDHANRGTSPPAGFGEPLQNDGMLFFVLGPSNGHHETSRLTRCS